MKEIKGNLFEQEADLICITTNGFVKSNGCAVMGKGCAAEAKKRHPGIDTILGSQISEHGNRVIGLIRGIDDEPYRNLAAFPVKPVSERAIHDCLNVVSHMKSKFKPGDIVPGWACIADPGIIMRSAQQLVRYADSQGFKSIVIPRPGCGAGELKWADVKEILENILDYRFSVITF